MTKPDRRAIYKVCISQKALLTNIHQQYLLDIHVWCKFIKLKLASTLSEGSVKFTKKSEWTIYTYTRPSGISLYRNFRCIFFNDYWWDFEIWFAALLRWAVRCHDFQYWCLYFISSIIFFGRASTFFSQNIAVMSLFKPLTVVVRKHTVPVTIYQSQSLRRL